MKRVPYAMCALLSVFMFTWGCDGGYDDAQKSPSESESQSEQPTQSEEMSMEAPSTTMSGEESMPDETPMSMEGQPGALLAPEQADGAEANKEGVTHYQQGKWDVAQEHFQKAVETNAGLAEAHYNLALTLDKLGRHEEATKQFQLALDHGADNPDIKDSGILKAHLGM